LNRDVQERGSVQELLDSKRNLDSVYSLIIREVHFDRYAGECVVVRMRVEGERYRKERSSVKIVVFRTELLDQWGREAGRGNSTLKYEV